VKPSSPVTCILAGGALVCIMTVCMTSQSAEPSSYCTFGDPPRDQRMAIWNECRNAAYENVEDVSNAALAPRVRVAVVERILAVPTGELDVSGDRVAVAERGGAVWVLTDRAKSRLPPPKFEPIEKQGAWFASFVPRFDPKDGSLVLLGLGGTAHCGGGDATWRWRWRDGWVLESDYSTSERPTQADPYAREPKGPFPGFTELGNFQATTMRQDARGRFWLVGDGNAYIHDHGRWWQVADAPSGIASMAAQGKDRVWISSDHGLYRATLLPSATPVDVPRRTPLNESTAPSSPPVGTPLPETGLAEATVQRVSIKVRGGAPLTAATYVIASPDQRLHFVDGRRIVVLDKGIATSYSPTKAVSAVQPLALSGGDSWLLSNDDIIRSHLSKASATWQVSFSPNALAMTDEAGWLATCRPSDPNPAAMRWNGANWKDVPELPSACYRSVALGDHDSAWIVGGLIASDSWPTSDGIMIHATGSSLQAYRVPEGALLSVVALSPDEVYAGGYDGLLVHRRGPAQTAFRVHGDPWVVALAVKGDLVAVAGEGLVGVIKAGQLFRVPARMLPVGTWRSAAFDSAGVLWAVGDPGIVRVSFRLP